MNEIEIVRCRECRFYEQDVIRVVQGIPIIVAHHLCKKWGQGCMTEPDGYCFMGRKMETADVVSKEWKEVIA